MTLRMQDVPFSHRAFPSQSWAVNFRRSIAKLARVSRRMVGGTRSPGNNRYGATPGTFQRRQEEGHDQAGPG
jgi:hypothetical protein